MKALITGFAPFGGESINPSFEAISRMRDTIEGVQICKCQLPTEFGASITALEKAIAEHTPDVVLCIGQAGGRTGVTPERIGINVDDARIPDNAGNRPIDTAIFPDGPAAYFSTLPIKAIVAAIRQADLPASVSNSAGTYVCNHIAYALLHLLASTFKGKGIRGGFIHVPYTTAQVTDKANMPSMSLENITQCLEIAVAVSASTKQDISMSDSTTH